MKLDPSTRALIFEDRGELEAFHRELGALLREVTIAAASSSADAEVATARAREVLARFPAATEALNAIRASSLVERSPG